MLDDSDLSNMEDIESTSTNQFNNYPVENSYSLFQINNENDTPDKEFTNFSQLNPSTNCDISEQSNEEACSTNVFNTKLFDTDCSGINDNSYSLKEILTPHDTPPLNLFHENNLETATPETVPSANEQTVETIVVKNLPNYIPFDNLRRKKSKRKKKHKHDDEYYQIKLNKRKRKKEKKRKKRAIKPIARLELSDTDSDDVVLVYDQKEDFETIDLVSSEGSQSELDDQDEPTKDTTLES